MPADFLMSRKGAAKLINFKNWVGTDIVVIEGLKRKTVNAEHNDRAR